MGSSVRSQQTTSSFRSQLKAYLIRIVYPPPWSPSLDGLMLGYNFTRFQDSPFLDSSAVEDLHQFCAMQMFLLLSIIKVSPQKNSNAKAVI